MKKIIVALLLIGPFFLAAESVQSFDAVIDVNVDGSVNVTEKITYDFGDNQKRGIFRTIPKTYQYEDATRRLEIELLHISRNGEVDTNKITNGWETWKLRIGKEDVFITGVHEYEITYKVLGALRYYSDIDELYWNVTGDEWGVPINSWSSQVVLPSGAVIVQKECYPGIVNQKNSCRISPSTNNKQISFQGSSLDIRDGATIAVGFTPDIVAEVIIEKPEPKWFGLLGVLGALVFYVRSLVIIKRKHHEKKSIIAQYDTYDDYSAMFTGYLIDGRLSHRDIAAGLIELAQNNYITITQYSKDTFLRDYGYIFELKKIPGGELTQAQKSVLELLFGTKMEVGATYDTKKSKPFKVSRVKALLKEIAKLQTQRKLHESTRYPLQLIVVTLIVIVISMIVTFGLSITAFVPVLFSGIWFFLLPLLVMKRITIKGYDAKNHIMGLKRYIEVTEKERIKFHDVPGKPTTQAPEKNLKTFSKYLPYAVAFGLEKQWAKEFEDIDISVNWFTSTDGSMITPVMLGNSVSGIKSSVSSSIPSTSSSSSGSGGGGFSGGGGGGGGGGSW